MIDAEYLTTTGIARLFGVNSSSLRACIDQIANFPKPKFHGNHRLYDRFAILEWAKNITSCGENPAEIFRGAYRQHQALERYGNNPDFSRINAIHRNFLSGVYATAEQKQIIEQKRLAARLRNPMPREIIRIRPDWIH